MKKTLSHINYLYTADSESAGHNFFSYFFYAGKTYYGDFKGVFWEAPDKKSRELFKKPLERPHKMFCPNKKNMS